MAKSKKSQVNMEAQAELLAFLQDNIEDVKTTLKAHGLKLTGKGEPKSSSPEDIKAFFEAQENVKTKLPEVFVATGMATQESGNISGKKAGEFVDLSFAISARIDGQAPGK